MSHQVLSFFSIFANSFENMSGNPFQLFDIWWSSLGIIILRFFKKKVLIKLLLTVAIKGTYLVKTSKLFLIEHMPLLFWRLDWVCSFMIRLWVALIYIVSTFCTSQTITGLYWISLWINFELRIFLVSSTKVISRTFCKLKTSPFWRFWFKLVLLFYSFIEGLKA